MSLLSLMADDFAALVIDSNGAAESITYRTAQGVTSTLYAVVERATSMLEERAAHRVFAKTVTVSAKQSDMGTPTIGAAVKIDGEWHDFAQIESIEAGGVVATFKRESVTHAGSIGPRDL